MAKETFVKWSCYGPVEKGYREKLLQAIDALNTIIRGCDALSAVINDDLHLDCETHIWDAESDSSKYNFSAKLLLEDDCYPDDFGDAARRARCMLLYHGINFPSLVKHLKEHINDPLCSDDD